jgi:PAS domain S-box-containing protein
MPDNPDRPMASRILITEDEPIGPEHLAQSLRNLGYDVVGNASTGESAVKFTEEHRPDLVLMDINLSGDIDGIQAAGQIRSQFDIPVIFLADCEKRDVIFRARVAEPYGFLSKPFSNHLLEMTIETALYKHAADKRVRESREQYRRLVEQSIDGIALGQGVALRFVNRAFARMFGFQSPEEMVGLDLLTLVAPEYRDLLERRALDRDAGKSVPGLFEFTALRKDGTSFDAELRVDFATDRVGKVKQGVVRDITERKRAEEALRKSEEKFRAFMDHSPAVAWMKDDQGRHVYVNHTYEKRFGVRLQDLLGKTDHELWPKEIADEFWKNDQFVLAGENSIEVTEETTDNLGSRCFWSILKFHFQDDVGNRYVGGTGIEITDLKKAEEALKTSRNELAAYSATLETKVKERTNELERSRAELKKYSKSLEKTNEALRIMIGGVEEKKKQIEAKIMQNLNLSVKPILDQVKSQRLPDAVAFLLQSLEFNISNIFSSFGFSIANRSRSLTSKEMRICEMIRSGLSSKQIARAMNISPQTVLVHRKNIRKKLSLAKTGRNLESYLMQISDRRS